MASAVMAALGGAAPVAAKIYAMTALRRLVDRYPEIEEEVRRYCEKLGPGGGYVLGSSTSIMEGIPPENFVALTQAVHKYGHYQSLGQAAHDGAAASNGQQRN